MGNYGILLTACINPGGMQNTVISDVSTRMEQYHKALNFYCTSTSLPIVFVDNSGYDLSFLNECHCNNLELISFSGNENKTHGKGYGEALIIEYAMKHSRLLTNCDVIIKITGRLIVENLNSLYNIHRFFLSKKTIQGSVNSDLTFCDSRIIIVSKNFLSFFLQKKEQISDVPGFYFEHVLCKAIKECVNLYTPFWIEPKIKGYSGSTGVQYVFHNSSISYCLVYLKYQWYILKKMKKA